MKNAPALGADLNLGATAGEPSELENVLKVSLPSDLKESLMIHNGQKGHTAGVIGNWQLLSTRDIVFQWTVWKDLLDDGSFNSTPLSMPGTGIKSDWWNPRWIPLTYDGAGNHHCIDLDPAWDGRMGQIITMWHDADPRELKGLSYRVWFEAFLEKLERGRWALVQTEYGTEFDSYGFLE